MSLNYKKIIDSASVIILMFSCIVFILVTAAFFCLNFIGIEFYIFQTAIVMTDMYLLSILIFAALKSDAFIPDSCWINNFLPTKTTGIFIFACLFGIIIFSFAGLYYHYDCYFNQTDAIGFSISNITSLSDFQNQNNCVKHLMIEEFISGLLLIAGAFGLLISSISNYKSNS